MKNPCALLDACEFPHCHLHVTSGNFAVIPHGLQKSGKHTALIGKGKNQRQKERETNQAKEEFIKYNVIIKYDAHLQRVSRHRLNFMEICEGIPEI